MMTASSILAFCKPTMMAGYSILDHPYTSRTQTSWAWTLVLSGSQQEAPCARDMCTLSAGVCCVCAPLFKLTVHLFQLVVISLGMCNPWRTIISSAPRTPFLSFFSHCAHHLSMYLCFAVGESSSCGLILFGGRSESGRCVNDTWIFDISRYEISLQRMNTHVHTRPHTYQLVSQN